MTPIVFGGSKYLWQGKSIRCIRVDSNIHAILTSPQSIITIPVSLPRNQRYCIDVSAKSASEAEIIITITDEAGKIRKTETNRVTTLFSKSQIRLELAGIGNEKLTIKIQSSEKTRCDIHINQVAIEIAAPEPVKEEQKPAPIKEIKTPEPIVVAKTKVVDRSMTTIGGNGYTWRGKNIKPANIDGVPCVELPNKSSSIFAKAEFVSGEEYNMVITARRTAGNGKLLVNIFGNLNVDGPHKSIMIAGGGFEEYRVIVLAPKFTAGNTVYFRIWRDELSTGKIVIKNIKYARISKPKIKPDPIVSSKAQSISKAASQAEKPRNKAVFKRKERVEVFDMTYKPYSNMKVLSGKVDAVFIREANDVPKVSIITPTRDGLELIKNCYTALVKNTGYPNWEWIVGDSCSTDGTVEFLREKQDSRIKVIEIGNTDGSFSSINNLLVSQASGEYLVFLNNDTEPQPFWLYNMISKMHRSPEIGIVGSKLLYPGGAIQHCGVALTANGPANIGKAVLKSFPQGFAEHDRFYQAVTAACLLIRKSDFAEVGGFDERYWFCYEDIDLCLKVKNNLGKKILYSSSSVVIHNESLTQKKHSTAGVKQKDGIAYFKNKWMSSVDLDFMKYQSNNANGVCAVDVSFVTCISNVRQYTTYIAGSLFKNNTKRNYELIPIFNEGNKHSASSALNLGLSKAKGSIIVLCHQDILFYQDWIDTLFKRIAEVEKLDKNWGIIGTAGITTKDSTVGVVHSLKGRIQWQQTHRVTFGAVQTVDEHCIIMRRGSGLKFDERMSGFHLYGPDICLAAMDKNMKNYGILNPLVHDSSSASLISGKEEFMKWLNYLANKWGDKFKVIRTPTSRIAGRKVQTYIKF